MDPVVTEVTEARELPLGSNGSRELEVRWSDGSVSAFSFYAEEVLLSEGDVVGRTLPEIRELLHRRDVGHLQRDDTGPDDVQPFFPS